MSTVRLSTARVVAKLTYYLLRLIGRNASNLPGWIALLICPSYLELIAKPPLCVAVTGTNGKTTVTNMIADVLIDSGYSVATNRIGSNIASGIASTLTTSVSWSGKPNKDACVLEVDERATRLILPYVKPGYLVVTGLFRDSLKRNAHPDYIFDVIDTYTPPTTTLILNADELCSARLGETQGNQRVYFGIEAMESDVDSAVDLVTDYSFCPNCMTKLEYAHLRYHHIGRAGCPACGFSSPVPDYVIMYVGSGDEAIEVTHQGVESSYPLISNATFNIYNELAAIAALSEMGLSQDAIAASLGKLGTLESRLKSTTVGSVSVIQAMSKGQSCVSATRTLDFVRTQPGRKVVVLVMDDWYDRKKSVEYVGWIYDTDFEFLADDSVVQVVACGPRCYDYELRLLLAGIEKERILRCELEMEAPAQLQIDDVDSVFVLYDTSTIDVAMDMKQALISRLEARK